MVANKWTDQVGVKSFVAVILSVWLPCHPLISSVIVSHQCFVSVHLTINPYSDGHLCCHSSFMCYQAKLSLDISGTFINFLTSNSPERNRKQYLVLAISFVVSIFQVFSWFLRFLRMSRTICLWLRRNPLVQSWLLVNLVPGKAQFT